MPTPTHDTAPEPAGGREVGITPAATSGTAGPAPSSGPAPTSGSAGHGAALPISVIPTGGKLTIDRVSADELVTVDGRLGLFTPLTAPGAGDPAATGNLQQIVDVLRKQVAELQISNAALTERLSAAQQVSTPADDFATGVQHAVDDLQNKLAATENPVSTFAVREFSLQAKVLVDVSALGTIGLRFVTPGQDVEATALSTVALTIVPLPRDAGVTTGTPAPADPAVDEIDGLSPEQLTTLRRAHVTTAASFHRAATRSTTAATLRGMLAVDRETLGRMTELAALLAVPGVDRTAAAVLHAAGITDPASLSAVTAADLVRRYRAAARRRGDPDAVAPSTARAQDWIDAARALTAGSDRAAGSADAAGAAGAAD